MRLPYSVEELRLATHELIAVNGLSECYVRPIAFYGYGELGVHPGSNPVDVVLMTWPWGTTSARTPSRRGSAPRSSWKRVGPNTIPHVAKATGIYLNSMLAVIEATRGLRGSDPPHRRRPWPTARENIFVVKDEVISTPHLLPRSSRITRQVIEIAHTLGYAVHEHHLIRSDLYVADELFMCGTAAPR